MHAADSVPNTRRCVNPLRVPRRVFSSRLNLHLFKMQTLTVADLLKLNHYRPLPSPVWSSPHPSNPSYNFMISRQYPEQYSA